MDKSINDLVKELVIYEELLKEKNVDLEYLYDYIYEEEYMEEEKPKSEIIKIQIG